MAEVLALSSGVAGLLSLVIIVADVSYRCISNMRNVSGAVQAYFREF